MEIGSKIIATGVRGLAWSLTNGRVYEVLDYIPEMRSPNYTRPACVVIKDDNGNLAELHASRFTPVTPN